MERENNATPDPLIISEVSLFVEVLFAEAITRAQLTALAIAVIAGCCLAARQLRPPERTEESC